MVRYMQLLGAEPSIGDMAVKKPSLAGQHESWELSAREVLIPLLRPGESLRIALSGATGWFEGISLVDLVMALLGGVPTSELNRTTYIGITDEDLVFATTKDPNKPPRLQRVPLGNVSIVKFKESRTPFLIDVLVIDTGTKRLTLSTGETLRPVIRELAATLARRRQEANMPGSAGHLQGTLVQQAPPLPLHVRLFRLLEPAPRDIATTLRANGPARASLRASRYSLTLFAASIAASLFFFVGLMALVFIFPTGPAEPLRDILLFILLLPVLLATLLCVVATLVAAGLAIYSILKRGERALTVIAALLAAAALIICYTVVALGAILLGGE